MITGRQIPNVSVSGIGFVLTLYVFVFRSSFRPRWYSTGSVSKLRSSTEADLLCGVTVLIIPARDEAKAVRLKPPALRHAVTATLRAISILLFRMNRLCYPSNNCPLFLASPEGTWFIVRLATAGYDRPPTTMEAHLALVV